MRIVIGLVVLAVVGFFGYRMYQDKATQDAVQQAARQATQQAQQAATQAADAAKQAAGAAQEAAGAAAEVAGDVANQATALVVGGVDVGNELKGLIEKASGTLGGITDQASAQAALPSLDELKGKVDGLTAQVDQLPTEGKKLLASLVGAALPPLKELVVKVGTIQGADAVKPALDAMVAKLETWANAPA
jgi:type II secretory pathway component PulL